MDKFSEYLRNYEQNIERDIKKRTDFIKQQVDGNGMGGVVVGISGGIDSAVTAALCVKALGSDRVTGVWMPVESAEVHAQDAGKLADAINLNLLTVSLDETYSTLKTVIEGSAKKLLKPLSLGNTKARLRMTVLYALANDLGYLVADTCNRSEIYIGYMTKGGDGLADFNPVGGVTKHEIRLLAKALNVPESIIAKPPTADLWEGQTDEKEMGFTYEQLDRYLITGEGDPAVIEKIERLHKASEHKRTLMPFI